MFEVKTNTYSGPLEKLLSLIEERQLEITTLSLAEVTADFLTYIKSLQEEGKPRILADFLVIASKLILIKSKVLLPSLELTDEEEEEIHNLEDRLKLYKEFKRASLHIDKLWKNKSVSHARPLLLAVGDTSLFYPPKELTTEDMVRALQRLTTVVKELVPQDQKIKSVVVSIEEKVRELARRMTEAAEHNFKNLIDKKSKKEIIVLFLAILHMFRENMIYMEQSSQFGDIVIKKPVQEITDIKAPQ